jgi:hypothetical protein
MSPRRQLLEDSPLIFRNAQTPREAAMGRLARLRREQVAGREE